MDNDPIIKISEITKVFKVGVQQVQVLKGISLNVPRKDFLIVFGSSGSGKSTLLHTILGLEEPTTGSIEMLGVDLYKLPTEDDRSEFRKRHIGMVYQQPNWIKALTVIENVAFPLTLLGKNKIESLLLAGQVLQGIGMANWANYSPNSLSSGQQQKIALARALVTDPEIIIADEPTGNLDYESGQDLMNMLAVNNRMGKTIIMVTHDLDYLKFAKTALKIKDGKVDHVYKESDRKELNNSIQYKRGDHSL